MATLIFSLIDDLVASALTAIALLRYCALRVRSRDAFVVSLSKRVTCMVRVAQTKVRRDLGLASIDYLAPGQIGKEGGSDLKFRKAACA